jgi:hypothetical protein
MLFFNTFAVVVMSTGLVECHATCAMLQSSAKLNKEQVCFNVALEINLLKSIFVQDMGVVLWREMKLLNTNEGMIQMMSLMR